MGRKKRENVFPENGFEQWGGYMNAKVAKLEEQYVNKALNESNKKRSTLFEGISIFVNGYTKPSADELKCLMVEHGGVYHHYFRSQRTSFIIASNLPDTKVKNLPSTKIVKPEWITDSINQGILLDYRNYLLHSNVSKTQPRLEFKNIDCKQNDCRNITTKDVSEESSKLLAPRTAVDPKFLEEFYNNSRLHHISQMGSMFKEYVNELRNKSNFSFPLRDKIMKNNSESDVESIFLTEKSYSKAIMHIDMDCFFVSVGLRKYPHLKGKPVAVTHAKANRGPEKQTANNENRALEFKLYQQRKKQNLKGIKNVEVDSDLKKDHIFTDHETFCSMSEIASCSYEARAKGLRNGMFMGAAIRKCPELKTIPYDFEGYKEVAYTLYDTVAQYTLDIEAVSCDEMYVDCTELLENVNITPMEFASLLREEIKRKTDCTCSVGFGENRLQARLATKKAKPNGQYHLVKGRAEAYFENILLADLPGVGSQLQYRLKEFGHSTCSSLRSVSLTKLQKDFGNKTGLLLYNYCRGHDDRPLNFNMIRKSISKNVNYGIRFQDDSQCKTFLKQVCQEVHSQMLHHKVLGKSITLKLMIRAPDAPVETAKFMGHGFCNNFTKTANLANATDNLDIITEEVLQLCRKFNSNPEDIRGIAIQISKLENFDDSLKKNNIQNFFKNNTIDKKSTTNLDKFNSGDDKHTSEVSDNLTIKLAASPQKPLQNLTKLQTKRPRGRPRKNNFVGAKNKILKLVPDTAIELQSMEYRASDIDENVLKELPEDIRQEIFSIYKIRPPSDKNEVNLVIKQDEENANSSTPNSSFICNTQEDILSLNCEKILNILDIWVKHSSTPLDCDIELINVYMQNLVMHRKIEDAQCLLKSIYRIIHEIGVCEWHKAYISITNTVQRSMVSVYGRKMAIFEKFNCCV